MEEQININQLVELKQLPQIMYQLEIIGTMIDNQLADIEAMEVTEENKQEVKKRKAEISKLNDLMEEKRKTIKKQILEPYEQFNEKYEETIKAKLTYANYILKEKIDDIENAQKKQKEQELREFANEYIENMHISNIVSFEKLNINVTLSASIKSLKEQIKGKLESISNDVDLIMLEDYKDEIFVEYRECLDYAKSKLTVMNRHKAMKELQTVQENIQQNIQEEQKIEETVDEIITPVEIETPEMGGNQMMIYTFTVTGTRDEIVQIRDFIRSLGVKYE